MCEDVIGRLNALPMKELSDQGRITAQLLMHYVTTCAQGYKYGQ